MADVNFTFRTPAILKEAFIAAAKLNNRNASILLRDFMQEYVEQNSQDQIPPQKSAEVTHGR